MATANLVNKINSLFKANPVTTTTVAGVTAKNPVGTPNLVTSTDLAKTLMHSTDTALKPMLSTDPAVTPMLLTGHALKHLHSTAFPISLKPVTVPNLFPVTSPNHPVTSPNHHVTRPNHPVTTRNTVATTPKPVIPLNLNPVQFESESGDAKSDDIYFDDDTITIFACQVSSVLIFSI